MATILAISRRRRYFIQSVLFFVFGYLLFLVLNLNVLFELLFILLFILVSTIVSHYPNVKLNNVIHGSILPLQLTIATTLFFYLYPNLNDVFQIFLLISFSFLYYIVSLVDNVFFVVQDREEQIPLYRVAVTWGQILSIIIAIPLYASFFKFNITFIWQSVFVFFSALLFSFYQFWSLSFDKDTKNPRAGEFMLLNLLVGFFAFAASISVSFFPTESFLRALYVSYILMFGLTYSQSHLKNDITDKFLAQSTLTALIFFLILFLFRP